MGQLNGLIGMPEAAAILGVHDRSARRTLETEGVEVVQVGGRVWVADRAAVERVAEDRKRRGVSGPGRPRRQPAAEENTAATASQLRDSAQLCAIMNA